MSNRFKKWFWIISTVVFSCFAGLSAFLSAYAFYEGQFGLAITNFGITIIAVLLADVARSLSLEASLAMNISALDRRLSEILEECEEGHDQ